MSAHDRLFLAGFAEAAFLLASTLRGDGILIATDGGDCGMDPTRTIADPLARRLACEQYVRVALATRGSMRNADRHQRGYVAGLRAAVGFAS